MLDTQIEAVEASPTAQKLLEALVRFRRNSWRSAPVGDLTISEVITLFSIRRTAEEEGAGVRISDLSTRLNVAAPTVTQQVNNLEKQGYVERNMDKGDRRVVRVSLTDKGEGILKKASDDLLVSVTHLVDHLGERDSTELASLLSKVSDYFQDAREVSAL